MIYLATSTSAVPGDVDAINGAGSVCTGKLVLDSNGSGEAKFVPNSGADAVNYEDFLKEDRQHDVSSKNP